MSLSLGVNTVLGKMKCANKLNMCMIYVCVDTNHKYHFVILQIKKRRPRRTQAEMELERVAGMALGRTMSADGEENDGMMKGKTEQTHLLHCTISPLAIVLTWLKILLLQMWRFRYLQCSPDNLTLTC